MISYHVVLKAWDKFFFEEKHTDGIALFRILWIGIIFTYFLFDLGNIPDFYGPHALLSLETVRSQYPYLHANLFHLFRPGYGITYALMAVYGLSLFLSLIGLFTRASLITALLLMTSFHQRNIWLLSSSEVLMRIVMILLVCSPCGHSLSVDSLLGRKYPSFSKPKVWSVWALRLIQLQLCVVYLWTAWHKIKGDDWFDGTAVYYASRLESMTNFSVPYLLDNMLFIRLSTWGTLALEIALGTLIWVKEFRRPVLFAGIIFHLGIEYMMSIPFFELNMMALLINFFTPEELHEFVTRSRESLIREIRESSLAKIIKEKIISTLRPV